MNEQHPIKYSFGGGYPISKIQDDRYKPFVPESSIFPDALEGEESCVEVECVLP